MNWLDFWASIIGSIASLAWPAAFVTAVWLFRKQLAPLLPHLRVKGGDWEASFRLDEAEKVIEQSPTGVVLPAPTPEETDRFEQIAALSPTVAILEIRRDVEAAVRDLAKVADIDSGRQGVLSLTRLLRSRGYISPSVSTVLDDIRTVGNAAAHDETVDFTPDEARRYRKLADWLIGTLQSTAARLLESKSSAP